MMLLWYHYNYYDYRICVITITTIIFSIIISHSIINGCNCNIIIMITIMSFRYDCVPVNTCAICVVVVDDDNDVEDDEVPVV
jgi:hypothetical protein